MATDGRQTPSMRTSTLSAVEMVTPAIFIVFFLLARRTRAAFVAISVWNPIAANRYVSAICASTCSLFIELMHVQSGVRTLALVEVLFAQGVSRFAFKQPTTAREGLGIALIVAGVALLVWAY